MANERNPGKSGVLVQGQQHDCTQLPTFESHGQRLQKLEDTVNGNGRDGLTERTGRLEMTVSQQTAALEKLENVPVLLMELRLGQEQSRKDSESAKISKTNLLLGFLFPTASGILVALFTVWLMNSGK